MNRIPLAHLTFHSLIYLFSLRWTVRHRVLAITFHLTVLLSCLPTLPWVAVFTRLACRSVGWDIACQVFSWAMLSSQSVIAQSQHPGAGCHTEGLGGAPDINPVEHAADSLLCSTRFKYGHVPFSNLHQTHAEKQTHGCFKGKNFFQIPIKETNVWMCEEALWMTENDQYYNFISLQANSKNRKLV